jgi:hypothetical protein
MKDSVSSKRGEGSTCFKALGGEQRMLSEQDI